MSSSWKKPSDKGQEEKKQEEGMEDQTAQKKKRGNSSKDKAASSIKSQPNVPSSLNIVAKIRETKQ